jgi:hypothetical protein
MVAQDIAYDIRTSRSAFEFRGHNTKPSSPSSAQRLLARLRSYRTRSMAPRAKARASSWVSGCLLVSAVRRPLSWVLDRRVANEDLDRLDGAPWEFQRLIFLLCVGRPPSPVPATLPICEIWKTAPTMSADASSVTSPTTSGWTTRPSVDDCRPSPCARSNPGVALPPPSAHSGLCHLLTSSLHLSRRGVPPLYWLMAVVWGVREHAVGQRGSQAASSGREEYIRRWHGLDEVV